VLSRCKNRIVGKRSHAIGAGAVGAGVALAVIMREAMGSMVLVSIGLAIGVGGCIGWLMAARLQRSNRKSNLELLARQWPPGPCKDCPLVQ